jgi:hypothetical protein
MTNEKNVIMIPAKSIYKGFFFLTLGYLQVMYHDTFQTQLSIFFSVHEVYSVLQLGCKSFGYLFDLTAVRNINKSVLIACKHMASRAGATCYVHCSESQKDALSFRILELLL